MKEHAFACRLVWTGAAKGGTTSYAAYSREHTVDVAGKPTLTASAATDFRGDAKLHNPEDLLMAALSACHFLSYAALCARRGVNLVAYEDEATGTMKSVDGVIRFTEVVLRPVATVATEDDAVLERARALHEAANAECFIAQSVAFPVRHEPTVRRAARQTSC